VTSPNYASLRKCALCVSVYGCLAVVFLNICTTWYHAECKLHDIPTVYNDTSGSNNFVEMFPFQGSQWNFRQFSPDLCMFANIMILDLKKLPFAYVWGIREESKCIGVSGPVFG